MASRNFRACFYYLLIFFLSCGYYIILDRVSPLRLLIPRWLLQVPESPIRRAPQSEVAIYLPLISATMFSRAFLLHDNNQTTVHSRKEIAGWKKVNHLIQWEMVGKAQLDGLSPLFLLLSMESFGLPHLHVIRTITSQILSHLLQSEGSPQFDGGPLVRRLRAHFCEFTIYSLEPESGQMPGDLLLQGPYRTFYLFLFAHWGTQTKSTPSMTGLFLIISLHLSSCYDHSYL